MNMYNYLIAHYKGGTPKALRKALPDLKIVVPSRGEAAIYKPGSVAINWGVSDVRGLPYKHNINGITFLNYPGPVSLAVDKRKTLDRMWADDVPHVEYTSDYGKAKQWLSEGRSVFGRKLLQASQGDGIVLANQREYKKTGAVPKEFETCRLWTKNFPKDREVRIHVFRGQIIDYQEKRQVNSKRFKEDPSFDKTLAKPDFWVRNFDNGWVFCHEGVERHKGAEVVATKAIKALGLDFGAVDILIAEDVAVVCEINTAPGLEGRTLEAYTKCFSSLMRRKHV